MTVTYLEPKQIKISLGLPSTFGKAEVETAALHLVEFFQHRTGLWSTFTFHDLDRYYRIRGWNPNQMLFGLMGLWHDDGGLGSLRESSYVIHFGDCLAMSEEFKKRVSKPTLDAQAKRAYEGV